MIAVAFLEATVAIFAAHLFGGGGSVVVVVVWLQLPVPLQKPPVHGVLVVKNAFAGQVPLEPLHNSETSHSEAAGRQTEFVDLNALAGQLVVDPVQVSSTSHEDVAGRQTVPAGLGFATHTPPPSHWPVPAHGVDASSHGVPAGARLVESQIVVLNSGSKTHPHVSQLVLYMSAQFAEVHAE